MFLTVCFMKMQTAMAMAVVVTMVATVVGAVVHAAKVRISVPFVDFQLYSTTTSSFSLSSVVFLRVHFTLLLLNMFSTFFFSFFFFNTHHYLYPSRTCLVSGNGLAIPLFLHQSRCNIISKIFQLILLRF